MNDLELCKAFAELEGVNTVMDSGTLYKRLTTPLGEQILIEPYNPIIDMALCFEAVIKYRVNIEHYNTLIEVNIQNEVYEVVATINADAEKLSIAVIECIVEANQ